MLRLVVKSNAVTSMGYDDRTRILELEYKNGTVYRFKDVPRPIWEELKRLASSGGSIGAYVNANIRDKYDFLE
jgi:KTSC domain